jgi:hypothetical protein
VLVVGGHHSELARPGGLIGATRATCVCYNERCCDKSDHVFTGPDVDGLDSIRTALADLSDDELRAGPPV